MYRREAKESKCAGAIGFTSISTSTCAVNHGWICAVRGRARVKTREEGQGWSASGKDMPDRHYTNE